MSKVAVKKWLASGFLTLAVLLRFLAILLIPTSLCANESEKIYLYSSHLSDSQNILLKGAFDNYLKNQHPDILGLELQPVADKSHFNKLMIEGSGLAYILLPEIFQTLLRDASTLADWYQPIMQGVKEDQTTYKKVLIGNKSRQFDSGVVVATSVGIKLSKALVEVMLSQVNKLELDKFQYLEVPKDADALMSVQFGMADLALVKEETFDALGALFDINSNGVGVIAQSIGFERMVVLENKLLGAFSSELLVSLFEMIDKDPDGAVVLSVLGLDGWKKVKQIKNIVDASNQRGQK